MMNTAAKRTFSILVCQLLLASLISCASSPTKIDQQSPKKQPQPTIRVSRLEKRIHTLINGERKKNGLSPLEWDDMLASVRRTYSKDMVTKNFFDHYSPG